MSIDATGYRAFGAAEPASQVAPRPADPRDVQRMNEVETRAAAGANKSAEPGEVASQADKKISAVKSLYEELKTLTQPTAGSIRAKAGEAFSDPAERQQALWYALNQEKSVSSDSELLKALKSELVGTFTEQLKAEPPASQAALREQLSEQFRLGAHKEQALFHIWDELKGNADFSELLDIVRAELGLVIQKNAMVRNLMQFSHKLDLS